MIAVQFAKARAETFIECIKAGKPIGPGPDGWTGNEMLALAGACYFAARSHGPSAYWLKAVDVANLHDEHREHVEESFENDLHAAIDCYAQLTMLVCDGTYDSACDPVAVALVGQEGDVTRRLKPVTGFYLPPDSGPSG
jgi:hypothetical protein